MRNNLLAEILSEVPTSPLYHYTTQAGLLGIVSKREIWATHTQYLNDQREYLHTVELVRTRLCELLDSAGAATVRASLQDMMESLDGIESMNVCVCSFSEAKDSLSQWRAYGGAASGFAIGFSGDSLARLAEDENFYLAPCIYDTEKQRAVVEALISEVLHENLERGETGPSPRGGNLCAYLNGYAPILKDPAFAEEREWRLISRPLSCRSQRFAYRQGASMIIPYYRIPIDKLLSDAQLKEIVVGPTPHGSQSARSVGGFLVRHELRHVPVTVSAVPYRNW